MPDRQAECVGHGNIGHGQGARLPTGQAVQGGYRRPLNRGAVGRQRPEQSRHLFYIPDFIVSGLRPRDDDQPVPPDCSGHVLPLPSGERAIHGCGDALNCRYRVGQPLDAVIQFCLERSATEV